MHNARPVTNNISKIQESKDEPASYARYSSRFPCQPIVTAQDLSPRSRRASWRSFGWMVTRLAWIAARLVSSNCLVLISGCAK